AELNRHEDTDSAETSYELCDEDPYTKKRSIEVLRNMIYVRYCDFRNQNPHYWRDVDWFSLTRLGSIFEGVLYDRPDVGRLIICRLVNSSRFFETLFPLFKRFAPADDLWKKVHFHGYDFTSLHRFIDPVCLPRRYGGIQEETSLELWLTKIRQYKNKDSRFFETLFPLFKRFAPADDLWKKVHFHGYDFTSLHRWEHVKMAFIEIAFQAEISRYEDPEFEEYAKRNCNECFETRHKFLRCRRFIPALAHKLVRRNNQLGTTTVLIMLRFKLIIMVRYEEFRHKNAYLYDCSAFGLQKVKNVYGRWESDVVPIEDVVRCALLMDEVASMQPKLQILGVTIVVDLEGLNISHVSQLTPTVASQIVSLMGQFIPAAVFKRMYFHGSDMNSLHQHIDPEYLPKEYGGCCRHFISTEEWISKIDAYKDDFIVKELTDLGIYIYPEYLPKEYGGCCRHFISTEEWISKIDASKDDFIVKELTDLGFTEYGGCCRHFISTEEWICKIDAYKDDFIVKELRDLGFT
ncbi:putative CRAL/TRIO domain-containing protein, partial [Operophtera brumata]